ncbi:Uncharacterised protein [Chryseobacterium taihuense]|uniref:DUF2946 domain-containing protein n=3 Tax=Chryseobacterium group TaxID=2782232 RepID=A0A101CHB8_9FLAO|nr:hypothetical protein AR686_06705 [Chryseobacterium aquaticum subsp. greenlandense]VFB04938.1 Uncharacterised protein [Chryseobacterium taihuense]
MKFMRVLFIVYFVALSLMPCMDGLNAQTPKLDFTYGLNTQQNEDSHSKKDSCSPLCSCNCCRVNVASYKVEPVIFFPKNIKAFYSKKIHFQKNDFAYLVYDQIWQPPKI